MAPSGADGTVASASVLVRDELRDQAESLRQLMMAVRPLGVDRPRSQSLSTPIHAYVDGLYGDGRAPRQVVSVEDGVELDWTTETVVLRIVQEAVRNVWRHSGASSIEVTVRTEGPLVAVTIADDGVGFDPSRLLFESGIGAMRSFAALSQGTLEIDSAPGRGTRVTARLGGLDPARSRDDELMPSPRLRLVGEPASVVEA
jgi:signal transduction histidine kinase